MAGDGLAGAIIMWVAAAIVPLLFVLWLTTGQYLKLFEARGRLSAGVAFAGLLAPLLLLLVMAPSAHGSYWLRYAVVAGALAALVRLPFDLRRMAPSPGSVSSRLTHGFMVLMGTAALAASGVAVSGFSPGTDEVIPMRFPLEGRVFVAGQGGASVLLNYHHPHPAQKYAVDFIAIDRTGRQARPFVPTKPSDFVIFGAPVVAPCTGRVAFARDGLEDAAVARRDPETAAGNMVALDCAGVTVILAHLRRGSVAVRAGDEVRAGDRLGEVGNSGNTTEPHLHIHAERGSFKGEFSGNPGIPMTFDGRFAVRNSLFARE